MYDRRLERVVLFGSRVRGDAHDDSDYVVEVFLRDLADLSTKIIVEEDGPFIQCASRSWRYPAGESPAQVRGSGNGPQGPTVRGSQ
jgi:hypothetical protein